MTVAAAELTDLELIRRTREGASDAFAELFDRHRGVALGIARSIAGPNDADDIVAESFAKVLAAIQNGGGPQDAFRSYLLTTVRNVHLNRIRSTKRETLVADHEDNHRDLMIGDGVEDLLEGNAITRAFQALPERWRTVLWLSSVEGRSNDEIAEALDLKPNAVAALSFRAREGLREAYLADHLLETADPACRKTRDLLPAYVRGNLTSRRQQLVAEHVQGCVGCAAVVAELSEVEDRLGGLLLPVLAASLGAGLWARFGGWFAQLSAAAKTALTGVAAAGVIATAIVTGQSSSAPSEPVADANVETWRMSSVTPSPLRPKPARATRHRGPAPATGPGTGGHAVATQPRSRPAQPTQAASSEGGSATAPPRGATAPVTTGTASTSIGTLTRQLVNGVFQVQIPVLNPTSETIMRVTTVGSFTSGAGLVYGAGWTCGLVKIVPLDFTSWSQSFDCHYVGSTNDPVIVTTPGANKLEVALTGPGPLGTLTTLIASLLLQ